MVATVKSTRRFLNKKALHIFSLYIFLQCHLISASNSSTSQELGQTENSSQGITVLSQYGITWTFSDPVQYGKFVTGDYYIIGPATIRSISPAPTGERNGSQINPTAGGGQAFDSRGTLYKNDLLVSLPLQIKPGDALLSSISLNDREMSTGVTAVDGSKHVKHSTLRTVSVLTCLATHPPINSFRPPYVRGEKPLFTTDQIRWDILPSIKLSGDFPSLSYYTRIFQRPWIVHIPDWACRASQPVDNMPNYYRNIAVAYSGASVLLVSDLKAKERLLYHFLQEGLDHYYSIKQAPSTRATNKWPILFTGLMLDIDEIKNCFIQGKLPHLFKEDLQTYYAGEGKSKLRSQIIPAGQGWTNWEKSRASWRNKPGTNFEHEHLHPSEWHLVEQANSGSGSGFKQEAYRHCCTSNSWVGMALAAQLMKATELWNHPAFFDYMDRWMEEDLSKLKPIVDQDPTKDNRIRWSEMTSTPPFIAPIWHKYRYVTKQ